MMNWDSLFQYAHFEAREKSFPLSESEESLLRSQMSIPPQIETYHPARKAEFLLGRWCASKAYEKSTTRPLSNLEIGKMRNPIWPQNILGAVTHNENWVMAAVSNCQKLKGLGIDIEVKDRVKPEIERMIMTSQDLNKIDGLTHNELLTLIFSAKESLYKALFPQVQKFFGFEAAAVTKIDLKSSEFEIVLRDDLDSHWGPRSRGQFIGKFLVNRQDLLTVLEIF